MDSERGGTKEEGLTQGTPYPAPRPLAIAWTSSLCVFFQFRAWLFRQMIKDVPRWSSPRKNAHVRTMPSPLQLPPPMAAQCGRIGSVIDKGLKVPTDASHAAATNGYSRRIDLRNTK
eukprot:5419911-Pyramimonas_sp.AAC.1